MKWAEVDQERWRVLSFSSGSVLILWGKFPHYSFPIADSQHGIWGYLVTVSAFFKKDFALLLHRMNLLPRCQHGSADYKMKAFPCQTVIFFPCKHQAQTLSPTWCDEKPYVLAKSLPIHCRFSLTL